MNSGKQFINQNALQNNFTIPKQRPYAQNNLNNGPTQRDNDQNRQVRDGSRTDRGRGNTPLRQQRASVEYTDRNAN